MSTEEKAEPSTTETLITLNPTSQNAPSTTKMTTSKQTTSTAATPIIPVTTPKTTAQSIVETNNTGDSDISKLEKARQELLGELEKIDSTLIKIKGENNKTSETIKTTVKSTIDYVVSTTVRTINDNGTTEEGSDKKGRLDVSLDEIVNRVVEKVSLLEIMEIML